MDTSLEYLEKLDNYLEELEANAQGIPRRGNRNTPSYRAISKAAAIPARIMRSIEATSRVQKAVGKLGFNEPERSYDKWSSEDREYMNILESYIQNLKKNGKKVPRRDNRNSPSFRRIQNETGIPDRVLRSFQARGLVHKAAKELGLADESPSGQKALREQRQGYEQRLKYYLSRIEEAKQKLPEHPTRPGHPHFSQMECETGIPYAALQHKSSYIGRLVQEAVKKVGLEVRVLFGSETLPAITYEYLLEKGSEMRKAELGNIATAQQQLYNSRSALIRLQRYKVRTKKDVVGSEMGSEFNNVIEEITKAISNKGTRGKFQTEIHRWRIYYDQILRSFGIPDDFHEAFVFLLDRSGLKPIQVARLAGVETSTVIAWYEKDSSPMPRSFSMLNKLERILKVPQGLLVSRVKVSAKGVHRFKTQDLPAFLRDDTTLREKVNCHLPVDFLEHSVDEQKEIVDYIVNNLIRQGTKWERSVKEIRGKSYRLKYAQWPDRAKKEFEDLANFKTARTAPIGKKRRGSWRASTCRKVREDFEFFFGALRLPPDTEDLALRGLGVQIDSLTIAFLICPQILHWYIKFRAEARTNYNSHAKNILANFKALLQPKVGWLRQNINLVEHLTPVPGYLDNSLIQRAKTKKKDGTPIGWLDICDKSLEYYQNLMKELCEVVTVSRNPFEPIQGIIKLENPIDYLPIFIDSIKSSLPNLNTAEVQYALAIRDCVSIYIVGLTGLRVKNIVELTYKSDNSGQLHKDNEEFIIEIPREYFKVPNSPFFGKGNAISDYRIKLPDFHGFYDLLNEYLNVWRPLLIKRYHKGKVTDALLIHTGRTPKIPESNFSATYCRLTAKHIAENKITGKGIPGVRPHRPHAVRHIRGTAIVIETGSLEMAADANQNSVHTARLHYTSFLPEKRNGRVNEVLFSKKIALRK